MGIETLEQHMNQLAMNVEVKEPIVVVPQNCEPGKVCEAKDYFEMITECAICGKLC
jgi:hypothetical protein